MESQKSETRILDVEAMPVEQAMRGEWAGIRVILKGAIQQIESGQSIHHLRAFFLAEALEKAEPESDTFARAADCLRRGEPLPGEDKSDTLGLLTLVLSNIREAISRQQEDLAENPPEDCSPLFSPKPPTHHFLDLDPRTAIAFRLRPVPNRGGRPRQDRPTFHFFKTFDALRGFGATRTQAQMILAHRFNVTERTIQKKLEQRQRYSLERKEGDIILVTYEPGEPRPEKTLEDGPPAFEPYLKARLATAVRSLQEEGISSRDACQQVAEEFGLHIEGELFGSRIVEAAVALCAENESGWARVPLTVCHHEKGRQYLIWPSKAEVEEARIRSVGHCESPAVINAISRAQDDSQPKYRAVEAAAKKFKLDYDLVVAMCRERIDPWRELSASCQPGPPVPQPAEGFTLLLRGGIRAQEVFFVSPKSEAFYSC